MTQPRVAPPLRLSCAGGGDVMRLLARGLRGTSTGQAPSPATQRPNVRYPSLSRPVWRREAGCPSGQRERSVKPSAQPTQVRTLDLPPPAKMAPDQPVCRSGVVPSYAVGCGRERRCAGGCVLSVSQGLGEDTAALWARCEPGPYASNFSQLPGPPDPPDPPCRVPPDT